MQSSPGSRGRLRILCEAPVGHTLLGAKLLWRVRQCRCHDVGGRDPDVQFPDSETCGQEEIPLRRPQQRPPGDKNEQKIDSPFPLPVLKSTTACHDANIKTSNTKAALVLGDPSKGRHAAESEEEMMQRASFIQFVCSVEMCI